MNTSKGTWSVLTSGTCKSSEQTIVLYTKSGADGAFLTQAVADARYLGLTAQAADSDKLDGQDSSAFMLLTNCIGYPHFGIDWHGCDLNLANLSGAILGGANLSGAELGAVIWNNTICPDGTNGDDNGGTCVGHL